LVVLLCLTPSSHLVAFLLCSLLSPLQLAVLLLAQLLLALLLPLHAGLRFALCRAA
jgi:hypothetical protein